MAAIRTKSDLSDYILRKLGSPVIDVEITPDQIEDVIDAVIREYSEYAIDGQEEKCFVFPLDPDINTYVLDDHIYSIINIRTASSFSPFMIPGGYVLSNNYNFIGFGGNGPMSLSDVQMLTAQFQMVQDYFNIPVNHTFNANNSKLVFLDNTILRNKTVLVHCWSYYNPEDVDGIYNHPWIKDMCVAKSRIQWSGNIGKYSASLLNGATINYEDMLSQGQAEEERLHQELLDRWSPPLGISVG
jgi:hypothetical protein